jgi:hypothetical protein
MLRFCDAAAAAASAAADDYDVDDDDDGNIEAVGDGGSEAVKIISTDVSIH